MKECGVAQTFAISFVLLLRRFYLLPIAHNNHKPLIFIDNIASRQKNSNPTRHILTSFKFIHIQYIKTRCINHSLTFKTVHLSLFVNL
ncbi:hypothetical protein F01_480326 [Burkholderia cenocepacia]|nr:hypothetical protein F01_480326 [Burkholderia cenocepacia]